MTKKFEIICAGMITRSVVAHRLLGSWRGAVVQPASSSNPRAKPASSSGDRLILAAAGFIEQK
jgi:hypothetical protein